MEKKVTNKIFAELKKRTYIRSMYKRFVHITSYLRKIVILQNKKKMWLWLKSYAVIDCFSNIFCKPLESKCKLFKFIIVFNQ